ncbi:hypothetical protein HGRIS_003163 [Hohenbuehelia grisea]
MFVNGSNGEAQHLFHEERKAVLQFVRKTLDENGFGQVVVIAGTGTQSTRETMKLNVDAAEAGASYALIFPPSTWRSRMDNEAIIRFYREVADASPIPIMIYNNPGITAGINPDSDTFITLGRHPNIVGTKLGCEDLGKLTRIVNTLPQSKFAAFVAASDALLPAIMVKGAGGNTSLLNVAPKAHRRMWDLYDKGSVPEAREIHRLLSHADWIKNKYGGPAFLKAVVAKEFGYGSTVIRGPLKAVSADPDLQADEVKHLQQLISLEKSL